MKVSDLNNFLNFITEYDYLDFEEGLYTVSTEREAFIFWEGGTLKGSSAIIDAEFSDTLKITTTTHMKRFLRALIKKTLKTFHLRIFLMQLLP